MNIVKHRQFLERLNSYDIQSRLIIKIQAEFISIDFHNSLNRSDNASFYYTTKREAEGMVAALLAKYWDKLYKI